LMRTGQLELQCTSWQYLTSVLIFKPHHLMLKITYPNENWNIKYQISVVWGSTSAPRVRAFK
jgi:hypothetical protein